MTSQDEQEHPVTEVLHELLVSWRETPAWGKWVLVLGLLSFLAFSVIRPPSASDVLIPLLRTLSLAAVAVGTVVNARAADAFFRQVYSEGCVFAVLTSAVLLFAAGEFHVNLRIIAVPLLLTTVLVGMAISFVRLRRA